VILRRFDMAERENAALHGQHFDQKIGVSGKSAKASVSL